MFGADNMKMYEKVNCKEITKPTTAERETFNKAKAGMTQGWTGSFDKLEDYLNQIQNS